MIVIIFLDFDSLNSDNTFYFQILVQVHIFHNKLCNNIEFRRKFRKILNQFSFHPTGTHDKLYICTKLVFEEVECNAWTTNNLFVIRAQN